MDGQRCAAAAACLVTSFLTASRPSGEPPGPENSGSVAVPPRSLSHSRSTATLRVVSGVQRSFRPFPRQRRWAPVPSSTSPRVSPVSSETRSPVWMATRSSAWSLLPTHVERCGPASSASISERVRKHTTLRSTRLAGMARTRWMRPACSGCRSAAKRNSERSAARRTLRVDNVCEQCDNFVTTPEFVPELESQLADVTALREDAEARAWDSEVARHARVIASIEGHLPRLNISKEN